ncbi:hypothetical protein E4L95_17810 [Paracoccus liaowanqingii]|uniref:Uncharacterized protein n=1 Tax=Paracoccus liaowanqingii TaxID=2560053 RepID=A0A4Z1CEH2_9RHOB|nr:HGGxSTG domain-containing protein [Paracoccus liaowanqingii]TGN50059.1 hypothetical protein E4L95_17810 [Paracoccus liaowanqingii]
MENNFQIAEVKASDAPPFPASRRPVIEVDDALRLQAGAAVKRALAEDLKEQGDWVGARSETREAEDMEQRAALALSPMSHTTGPPSVGAGGEMVVATAGLHRDKPQLIDTVRTRPDMQAARASQDRLELAGAVGVLPLAADMADTVNAANSVERALAHQMAAAHATAMRFAAQAKTELDAHARNPLSDRPRSVEAARMAATSARLMDAFTRSALALDRLKNGGQQVVVVKHQQNTVVQEGGKAVVVAEAAPPPPGGSGQEGGSVVADEPQAPAWRDALALAAHACRCGARTRQGMACQAPAMPNGRCRMHGGTSTGPRTPGWHGWRM